MTVGGHVLEAARSPEGSRFSYRGTPLGPAEMGWLQAAACERPQPTVVDLADRACRRFGWIRSNGEPAVASCSVFLRCLARKGALRLPPPRVPSGRITWRDDEAEMLHALGTIPGMVECQPEGPLTVRPIAKQEWTGFALHMDRHHYLGFSKPSGESICYAAFVGAELVALMVWGAAVPYNAPRDRYIGWDSPTRSRLLDRVVNQRRFLVLPWIRLHCLASRVLAANVRRLSQDWEEKYAHPVLLAETFVDVARYRGTCYRAANWVQLGRTQGFSRLRVGFAENHRPKAVFVYPLHPRAPERLRAGQSGAPGPSRRDEVQ
ncbi:MAG: Druantia anti-phage system protein DruA [candidate division NC10 bacterium]